MTVVAQVGTLFESLLTGAPIGLTGLLGWQLLDPATGADVIARRTTGITEPAPGAYFTSDTAPLTAGDYLIVWDYLTTAAAEDLVVQVAPIIGPHYATVTDLRNYSQLVVPYSDDDLNATLRQAEMWIDSDNITLPVYQYQATGLKYDPPSLPTQQAVFLNKATCAQAEYMLHMGPGFFISGATSIAGGDYTEYNAPKVPRRVIDFLIDGGFIRKTARVDRRRWISPYGTMFGGYGDTIGLGWGSFERPQ